MVFYLNKKSLIEQCKRLVAIHEEESKEIKEEEQCGNEWVIIHNEGHNELINNFIDFLNKNNSNDKKVAKKWLRDNIKKSDKIINELEEKYNHFDNDEEMSPEDERTHFINDGSNCMAETLISIIDGKRYISKFKERRSL